MFLQSYAEINIAVCACTHTYYTRHAVKLTVWDQGDVLSIRAQEVLSSTTEEDWLIYSVEVQLACHDVNPHIISVSGVCFQNHLFRGIHQGFGGFCITPVVEDNQPMEDSPASSDV